MTRTTVLLVLFIDYNGRVHPFNLNEYTTTRTPLSIYAGLRRRALVVMLDAGTRILSTVFRSWVR